MAGSTPNGDPLFSVLTPVYHPPIEFLREAIDSVIAQTESSWELILVLDGPHDDDVSSAISSYDDPRISVVRRAENGGISAASNSGLEVARGAFVALLDHDDTLAPFALASCREAIERWPDTDVLYSDEDKLTPAGDRWNTFFKPAFSPEWLRCHMYLGHLGVYRRSLIDEVGGFRPEVDGSQDHDLALRTTEQARRVVHVPRVLYHWRQVESSTAADPENKTWAFDAAVRVVQDALDRQGIPARAERRADFTGIVHIEPDLDVQPLVSIVIPTAGGERMVKGNVFRLIDRCLRSIKDQTTYENYEVVVVVDGSAWPPLEDELRTIGLPRLRFLRNDRPFNFSEACNLGRDAAHGDVLVFLNDDTEVVTENWLERLVLFASIDGVGAVGVKLVYSDGTIQHVGLLSRSGVGHRGVGIPGDDGGPFGIYTAQTNVIAVTGACLAVRTDRFDHVGGFTRMLPLAFNDIDLCLKLFRAGYRTVLDPQVTLIHHESSSRDPAVNDHETGVLWHRWRYLLEDDPYDNPHLRQDVPTHLVQEAPEPFLTEFKEWLGTDAATPRPWPPDERLTISLPS